jgi:NAD(P)H dehydrogenase (quinone)
MKISVILAHPDKNSFNHAIARAAVETLRENGHEIAFHDLYHEKFPAILPAKEIPRGADLPPVIRRHCAEIAAAEGIIIVHPNWWGQPPAILKGWVDRVLRPGVAYKFEEGDSLGAGALIGLLKANVCWCSIRRIRPRKGNYRCSATLWRPSGKTTCFCLAVPKATIVRLSASSWPAL